MLALLPKQDLTQKLSALDDHLLLTAVALTGLRSGEPAYLRQLSSELRTLLGYSSGTEGTAHESDGLRPVLAELNAFRENERQVFFQIVLSDAILAIQLGESILKAAEQQTGYSRRHVARTAILRDTLPDRVVLHAALDAPRGDPVSDHEGTIVNCLRSREEGWEKANRTVHLPVITAGRITVTATKLAGNRIEVRISGLGDHERFCSAVLGAVDPRGIVLVASWKRPSVHIFIDGQLVTTLRY